MKRSSLRGKDLKKRELREKGKKKKDWSTRERPDSLNRKNREKSSVKSKRLKQRGSKN